MPRVSLVKKNQSTCNSIRTERRIVLQRNLEFQAAVSKFRLRYWVAPSFSGSKKARIMQQEL